MNKFYIYVHKTADTGVPFYIGKGCKNRAYVTAHRNKFWKSIVKKHGFIVEIIASSLNELEAFYLENFYIKGFGRRDSGGLLVNQTDGGEGQSGARASEEKKKLMSRLITGKILKPVDSVAIINDYQQSNSLKQTAKKHGICIATAMKYIPKELRQESRSANGRLNSVRLLGKKPWNYGKGNPSN